MQVLDIRGQLIGGCPRLLRSALAAASIGHLLVALRACTVGASTPLMRFANPVRTRLKMVATALQLPDIRSQHWAHSATNALVRAAR